MENTTTRPPIIPLNTLHSTTRMNSSPHVELLSSPSSSFAIPFCLRSRCGTAEKVGNAKRANSCTQASFDLFGRNWVIGMGTELDLATIPSSVSNDSPRNANNFLSRPAIARCLFPRCAHRRSKFSKSTIPAAPRHARNSMGKKGHRRDKSTVARGSII